MCQSQKRGGEGKVVGVVGTKWWNVERCGALPWSIQQRSHTPPDPLMLVLTPEQPKDLSASLEDILASLSYTFSACIVPIIPIWCYQIQCLTKAKASCADLVLPPSYPVWVPIRGLSRTSPRTILSRWTAWTNLTHADPILPPSSPFKISSSQFSFWPNQCIATRL